MSDNLYDFLDIQNTTYADDTVLYTRKTKVYLGTKIDRVWRELEQTRARLDKALELLGKWDFGNPSMFCPWCEETAEHAPDCKYQAFVKEKE